MSECSNYAGVAFFLGLFLGVIGGLILASWFCTPVIAPHQGTQKDE